MSKPSAAGAFQIRRLAQEWFVRGTGRVLEQNLADSLPATRTGIGCIGIAEKK